MNAWQQEMARDAAFRSTLNEMTAYPTLAAPQSRVLARRARRGDHAARQTLIEGNYRLVIFAAKPFAGHGVAGRDLLQEGTLGLMVAVDKYDPATMRCAFSTLAVPWIRSGISRLVDALCRPMAVPEKVQQERNRARRRGEDLPIRSFTSLDMALPSGDDLGEVIPDERVNVAEVVELTEMQQALAAALATLPAQQRQIVAWRYGLTGDPVRQRSEIANELHCSIGDIRAAEDAAMKHLRMAFGVAPAPSAQHVGARPIAS